MSAKSAAAQERQTAKPPRRRPQTLCLGRVRTAIMDLDVGKQPKQPRSRESRKVRNAVTGHH